MMSGNAALLPDLRGYSSFRQGLAESSAKDGCLGLDILRLGINYD